MPQSANMELVENLRPFIQQMIENALTNAGVGTGLGNNLEIDDDGNVALSTQVEVEEILRVGSGAIIELHDEENDVFRRIRITVRNNQPYLEFAEPSTWEGLE